MNFVKIRNLLSDKFVTVSGGGSIMVGGIPVPRGEPARPAELQLWPDLSNQTRNGNFNQHWYQIRDGQTFKFLSRRSPLWLNGHGTATGAIIDARGGLNLNAYLQQYPDNNGNNQRWQSGGTSSTNNYFFIVDAEGEFAWELPIDEHEDPTDWDGADIWLAPLNQGDNQAWRIETVQVDAFLLRSRANQLVIDVPSFSQNDGVGIQQFPKNGGFNQLWEFLPTTDGFGMLRSVCSGRVLDVGLRNIDTPSFIFQHEPNGAVSQEYRLNVVDKSQDDNDIVEIIPRGNQDFAVGIISFAVHEQIPQYTHDGGIYQLWEKIPIISLGQ